jgi:hypothetical protein
MCRTDEQGVIDGAHRRHHPETGVVEAYSRDVFPRVHRKPIDTSVRTMGVTELPEDEFLTVQELLVAALLSQQLDGDECAAGPFRRQHLLSRHPNLPDSDEDRCGQGHDGDRESGL